MSVPVANWRKECAAVLGQLGVAATRKYLVPFEDDTDPDVRKNVRWTLSQLASSA